METTGLVLKVATLDEANLVLKALGKLPLEETVGLWSSLREQVFRQLPQPAPPIAQPPRRRHRRNGATAPSDLVGNVAT